MTDVHDRLRAADLSEGGVLERIGWTSSLIGIFICAQRLIGVVIGLVVGVGMVARGTTAAEAAEFAKVATPGAVWTVIVAEAALLLVLLFVSLAYGWRRVGLRLEGTARSLLLLAPLGAVLAWSLATTPGFSWSQAVASPMFKLFIVLAVLVGLTEELFFRGLIVGMLGGPNRPALAIIGSAILFGAPHVIAPTGQAQDHPLYVVFTIALLFGVPFAVVYIRTGSILGLALVHAAWDAIVFGGFGFEPVQLESGPGIVDFLVPSLVALAYGSYYVASSGWRPQLPERTQRLRTRREQPLVDWDALGEAHDDPLVAAQIRRALAN